MGQRGQGGKPGQLTILTRKRATRLAHQLEATGETMLDIMVDNALFWHRSAQNMGDQIKDLLEEAAASGSGLDEDVAKDLAGILKNFTFARDRSQACAEGAAPYMHAKLASITMKKEEARKIIQMTLDKPADGEDRSYRDGYPTPGLQPVAAVSEED